MVTYKSAVLPKTPVIKSIVLKRIYTWSGRVTSASNPRRNSNTIRVFGDSIGYSKVVFLFHDSILSF